MDSKFLEYYFEKKIYVENPPLSMNKFIKFCKKRGIDIKKSKLEELERNGYFYPIFRYNAKYNELRECYEPCFTFDSYFAKNMDFSNVDFYVPQDKNFVEFDKFYDKNTGTNKICSYYSSFQIYPLVFLLNNQNILNFSPDKIVDLLIAIQIYSPYGRSNMRTYSVKENLEDFRESLNKFNLKEVLSIINVNEDALFEAYICICNELKKYLGSNEAIQLWKCVDWKKKDKTIGHTRLGIEYLQWAMMLKRCIEDYLGREIFDVDEVIGQGLIELKNNIPADEKGHTLRGYRNRVFTNEDTGEYEFNLKKRKLYYLANDLTLDYHPKIILFVEGKTEEIMIPKFFKFIGYNHVNLGIEIINIEGITNFYSPKTFLEYKPGKSIVNNFLHLNEFNLEKWQSIPFIICDNENDICNKLKEGKAFRRDKLLEHIPDSETIETNVFNDKFVKDWVWIWENDFEIDNFRPTEIQRAINDVCEKDIPIEKVKNIYESCKNNEKKGINDIDKCVKKNKIKINEKAFEYMKKDYENDKNHEIMKRPIFAMINKLLDIAVFNHFPINKQHDLINKEKISLGILKDYDIFNKRG